jgi:hypothetical protein
LAIFAAILMVLTTLSEEVAPASARWMINQASSLPDSRAIIEMVTEIMVYKFANLSRREVDEMLGIKLEETRVYREAREEGRVEEAQTLELCYKIYSLPHDAGRASLISPVSGFFAPLGGEAHRPGKFFPEGLI